MIWCQLRGFGKTVQRGVYQPYNASVLTIAVIMHLMAGRVTEDVAAAFVVSIPATVIGALLGAKVYHLIDDKVFLRIILIMLLLSGLGLLVRNIPGF